MISAVCHESKTTITKRTRSGKHKELNILGVKIGSKCEVQSIFDIILGIPMLIHFLGYKYAILLFFVRYILL